MSQDLRTFKKWFAIGAAVLLVGLALQWFPNSVVNGINERLTQTNLTAEQTNNLQDQLNSWNVWQASVFQPLSIFFFTAGIIMLIYSILSALFSIASSYTTAKKEEKQPQTISPK